MAQVAQSAVSAVATGAYTALNTSGFTALSALFKYRVPQNTTATTYSVIQNFTEQPMDCFGPAFGKDVTFQVHVVTTAPASEPYAALSKAVELLNYAAVTVGSHEVLAVQYENVDSFDEDVDGILTRHVVGMFRARVRQAT